MFVFSGLYLTFCKYGEDKNDVLQPSRYIGRLNPADLLHKKHIRENSDTDDE